MADESNASTDTPMLASSRDDVVENGARASGVRGMVQRVHDRIRCRRNGRSLCRHTIGELKDQGWTSHDVAGAGVPWVQLQRKHGASALVYDLGLGYQDAQSLGITPSALLNLSSDIHRTWSIGASDLVGAGVPLKRILGRYKTSEALRDVGFTVDMLTDLGMDDRTRTRLFGDDASGLAPAASTPLPSTVAPPPPPDLSSVSLCF